MRTRPGKGKVENRTDENTKWGNEMKGEVEE